MKTERQTETKRLYADNKVYTSKTATSRVTSEFFLNLTRVIDSFHYIKIFLIILQELC